MARWRRTNPLALAVLVTLFDHPRHPYDIARTLKTRHHDQSMRLNFGSLYAVVPALEREGFVEATEVERDGKRPERTVYRVTDDGIAEARDWLADLIARPTKEYLAFDAALTLIGAMEPDEVLALLDQRLGLLTTQLAASAAGREAAASQFGLPRLFLIETEYAEALLLAEIDFVSRLASELRDGSFPNLADWRAWSAGHRPDPAP
jgi:DNA-binding PadR family transcriptional regulator